MMSQLVVVDGATVIYPIGHRKATALNVYPTGLETTCNLCFGTM